MGQMVYLILKSKVSKKEEAAHESEMSVRLVSSSD